MLGAGSTRATQDWPREAEIQPVAGRDVRRVEETPDLAAILELEHEHLTSARDHLAGMRHETADMMTCMGSSSMLLLLGPIGLDMLVEGLGMARAHHRVVPRTSDQRRQ